MEGSRSGKLTCKHRLAEDALVEPFQRASGLSPQQFTASDRDFTDAIDSAVASRKAGSQPSTPHRDANLKRPINPAFSGASTTSADLSPEARRKRTRDIMSGAAFASTYSSPLSRNGGNSRTGDELSSSAPQTPTKRTLRDRSSIKEARIFDPSEQDRTPTKKVKQLHTPNTDERVNHSAKRRAIAASQSSTSSPSKPAAMPEKRATSLVGYPAGEPFRLGRSEVMGEWKSKNSSDRVQAYIAALERCSDQQGWEDGEVVGQLHLPLG